VLVKTSYFPNWQADGADGPYQVAPNLMVVVPTTTQVTLTYEDIAVDRTAQDMTMLGAIGLVVLAHQQTLPTFRKSEEERGEEEEEEEEALVKGDSSEDGIDPEDDHDEGNATEDEAEPKDEKEPWHW
jgi:hypothetical protein